MSPRSWHFARVSRAFQGASLGILTCRIRDLSPPRVFGTFTRGPRRCKGADIAKKTVLKNAFNKRLLKVRFLNV